MQDTRAFLKQIELKRLLKPAVFALGLALFSVVQMPVVQAANSRGISALALNPAGDTLMAAGSNRVIYKLDPESLKVVERHWIKVRPIAMEYSSDGNLLLVQSDRAVVYAMDPKTFKVKKKLRKARYFSYAPGANKIVVADNSYEYKTKKYFTNLRVLNGETFKLEKKLKIPGQTAGLDVDDDATTVSIITNGVKDTTETRESPTSDMSDAERTEFRQRHDQRSSEHIVVSLSEGEKSRHKSWFSFSGNSTIVRTGDGVMVLPFYSGGAYMKDAGETSFVNTGTRSQNGALIDGDTIITGSFSSITVKDPSDEESTVHKFKKLAGSGDYPVSIIKGKDGFFASTNGFRVIRFTPTDGIDTVEPVY